MFTNLGLVAHVTRAFNEKWKYVYGTIGKKLTRDIIGDLLQRYPEETQRCLEIIETFICERTVDCVNLIKSYLWWDSETDAPIYNIKHDKVDGTWMSADGAFKVAKEKGLISTIPDIPGICVRYSGHIGVYIGEGEVIESRGINYGVVKTKLKERPWTHWLKYPGIRYIEEPQLTWQQIIDRVGASPDWKQSIPVIVKIAETDEELGKLRILRFLPELVSKIYYNKEGL